MNWDISSTSFISNLQQRRLFQIVFYFQTAVKESGQHVSDQELDVCNHRRNAFSLATFPIPNYNGINNNQLNIPTLPWFNSIATSSVNLRFAKSAQVVMMESTLYHLPEIQFLDRLIQGNVPSSRSYLIIIAATRN